MNANRPIFLEIWRIQLPPTGIASILHRISGLLMVLAIPAAVALLAMSLSSPAGFAAATTALGHPLAKAALLVLAWSLLHHLFAGLRHLLLDLGIGLEREAARKSAWVAIGAAVVALVAFAGGLLL